MTEFDDCMKFVLIVQQSDSDVFHPTNPMANAAVQRRGCLIKISPKLIFDDGDDDQGLTPRCSPIGVLCKPVL